MNPSSVETNQSSSVETDQELVQTPLDENKASVFIKEDGWGEPSRHAVRSNATITPLACLPRSNMAS